MIIYNLNVGLKRININGLILRLKIYIIFFATISPI